MRMNKVYRQWLEVNEVECLMEYIRDNSHQFVKWIIDTNQYGEDKYKLRTLAEHFVESEPAIETDYKDMCQCIWENKTDKPDRPVTI